MSNSVEICLIMKMELIRAAKRGNAEEVNRIITKLKKELLQLNQQDRWGYTAIMTAAARGHKDIVKMLIDSGARLQIRSKDGYTALTLAALFGHNDIVKMLMEAGADIEVKDKDGWTPVMKAVDRGDEDLAKLFVEAGADLNANESASIMTAVTRGDINMAKILIEGGADLNVKNECNYSPILLAAFYGYKEIVKMLMDAGARVETNKRSAMMCAASKGHKDIVKMMMEAGADLHFRDELGRSIFEVCTSEVNDMILDRIAVKQPRKDKMDIIEETLPSEEGKKQKTPPPLHEDNEKKEEDITLPAQVPVIHDEASIEFPEPTKIMFCELEADSSESALLGRANTTLLVQGRYMLKRKNAEAVLVTVAVKIMYIHVLNMSITYEKVRERAWAEVDMMYRTSQLVSGGAAIMRPYGVVEGAFPEDFRNATGLCTSAWVVGLVMHYEGGLSLQSLLHGKGKRAVSMSEKLRILRGVAEGLSELHAIPAGKHIVHAEIKPDNVLIGDLTGIVKLADFGLFELNQTVLDIRRASDMYSRQYDEDETPVYSAPELFPTPDNYGIKTPTRMCDMYAFGMIAWEVLTETRPFNNIKVDLAVVYAVQKGDRPNLAELPSDTPSDMIRMIECNMDADREKRLTANEAFLLMENVYQRYCRVHFDIFISHSWTDKYLLKQIFCILSSAGYSVWLDVMENNWDLQRSISEGIKTAGVVVACVSRRFQENSNCMRELEAARDSSNSIVCLTTECDPSTWARPELEALCSFESKLFCDISQIADLGGTTWETPSEDMRKTLQDKLKPLFSILNELGISKSL